MESLKTLAKYEEQSIRNRFFKHSEVLSLLHNLNPEKFRISVAGHSAEERSINLVEFGSGPTRVFLWSQMHGDEATATMALFDLFNFLVADDEWNNIRQSIYQQCTLYIMPMVNPDGAEIFTRRNAQGIDINRDYLRRQTPEGRVLAETRDRINPHFGFNLHDQGTVWSAGRTGNPATISLLAPAFNQTLSVNNTRLKAMQVVSAINEELQQIIPGHVGRFNDEYEPRAFGDNFQAAGTSTILIEAGGYADDSEKQFIRKVYFKSILKGLEVIASESYKTETEEKYLSIPQNEKLHFQILIKNCEILNKGLKYNVDLGLVAAEHVSRDFRSVTYTYVVEDIGDLSAFNGYQMLNAAGMQVTLIKPLVSEQNADLIIRDGMTSILSIENGQITDQNF